MRDVGTGGVRKGLMGPRQCMSLLVRTTAPLRFPVAARCEAGECHARSLPRSRFPPRSAARWQGADSPLVASVAVSPVRYVEHPDDLLISAPAGRNRPLHLEKLGLDL